MNAYYQQVQLLIKLLGFIDTEPCFALKGGTAINLFVQNLPRLSVDIDLQYLPNQPRPTALSNITTALDRVAKIIAEQLISARVVKSYLSKDDALRLVVFVGAVMVKVEVSPVLRGTVFPAKRMAVVQEVEQKFGYAEINVVSFADLYAGKICAALDRQHPRDLFDTYFLLKNQSINDEVRKAFIVYLISHPRPITEVLNPRLKPLSLQYKSEFSGMTFVDVSLSTLKSCRQDIIKWVKQSLTDNEKQFLLSFQQKQTNWTLLGLDDIEKLPAVKWKQLNLAKMSAKKCDEEIVRLKQILQL